MSASRSVTLYILRPACTSAAVMTVPLSMQGFLHAALVLSLPASWKHLDHVDDDAAGGERFQVLEAELGHVVLVDELAHRGLVVVAVLDADVSHAVEVRAYVALAEPGVFHVGELVLAERCARGKARGGEDGLGEARAEQRHAIDQRIRHVRDLAGLDLGGRRLGHRGVTRLVAPVWSFGPHGEGFTIDLQSLCANATGLDDKAITAKADNQRCAKHG